MSLIKKLLDKTELSILFKPRVDDEAERQKTIDWINRWLIDVVKSVLDDIRTEAQGFYPHPENQQALNPDADSLGYIRYIIKNDSGERLELPPLSLVSCNSIKMTDNYRKLKSLLDDAGYNIELKEFNIDSTGVKTYDEPDEGNSSFKRYFIILVSGW